MRGKLLGIITILLLAPITAELLQAYLGDLGGVGGLLFVVLFFAPFYGAMALMIREISVRTGRGWPGRLLLASAFGVAMPTMIDLSIFTPARDDIDGWDSIISAVSYGGIGWFAMITWVGGHVLMSVAAPIVVGESLARRPGPWLGRIGLILTPIAFLGLAWLVHDDQVNANPTTAGFTEYAVSGAVVAVLVALAFTPLGRPLSSHDGSAPSVPACFGAGLLGMAFLDLVPPSWPGLSIYLLALAGGLFLVSRWATRTGWTQRHLAALTFGALLTRTLTGFLAPLPQDTTWAEKITQNCSYLALILLLGLALWHRTRPPQDAN